MALKVGDVIPKFTAKDADGNLFESQSVIGKKQLLFIFIQKIIRHNVPLRPVVFGIIMMIF